LAESDALLKRASEVVAIRGVRIESLRMERDEGRAIIEGLQRVLAQRDATIERLGEVAADTIDLLTKERDEAHATIERVEALADTLNRLASAADEDVVAPSHYEGQYYADAYENAERLVRDALEPTS